MPVGSCSALLHCLALSAAASSEVEVEVGTGSLVSGSREPDTESGTDLSAETQRFMGFDLWVLSEGWSEG